MNYEPAPWFFDNGTINDREGVIATPAVALDTDEGMAIATLIAAAPELYDALKEAVKSLEWASNVLMDIPPNSKYADTIKRAHAALDNATWYSDDDAARDNFNDSQRERRMLACDR
jgi:hypothetical protein